MRISRQNLLYQSTAKILKLQLKTLNNFDSVNSILVKVGQSLTNFDQVNFDSVN